MKQAQQCGVPPSKDTYKHPGCATLCCPFTYECANFARFTPLSVSLTNTPTTHTLTSPSEDCNRRSFRQYAVKSPTPALTSIPLGASRVRVRVGDSSLRTKQRNRNDSGCGNSGIPHLLRLMLSYEPAA